MPDHLPLAGQAGRLNLPAQPEQPATFWRRFLLWDTFYGTVLAVTAYVIGVVDRQPTATRAGALVLVAALAVWYATLGRPLMRAEIEDWRAYLYAAVALSLFLPAVALVDGASFMLWVLCAQAYMLMSAVRATVTVLVYNIGYLVVVLLRTGDAAATSRGPLPVAVLAVVGSAVLGTWARRVWQQNDDRARLVAQLEESRAEVARLSHEAGAAAERQRISGEIHDTIAQGLSSVVMLIQAAEADIDRDSARARRHLALAAETARDNLGEARALVGALTPSALSGSSLPDALSRLIGRFTAETGVRAGLDTGDESTTPPRLSTAMEVVLLRAAQESLSNVRNHAGATEVSVRLRHLDGVVLLEIRDDGRGFRQPAPRGGYGLAAMRGRVDQVAGTLTVDSAPGAGTTVRVRVPVR